MMTLAQVHQLLRARWPDCRMSGDPDAVFGRVHTDTRTIQSGDLFLALLGQKFDAHDYLPQARQAGAVAAIVSKGASQFGGPCIEVPDTLEALAILAAARRRKLTGPLLAVTGSNGKTTVTQMLAQILRQWRGDRAGATQGNFNNEVGLPLTLLGFGASVEVAVLELGMNHPGEIDRLARVAQPNVALVNNAQREHQEFMATVEAVARENGSVFAHLAAGGVAVFPAKDEFTPLWQALAGAHPSLRFQLTAGDDGSEAGSDEAGPLVWGRWTAPEVPGTYAKLRVSGPDGRQLTCHPAVIGEHHLKNAVAAVACAWAAGVPDDVVAAGLTAFRPVAGRCVPHVLEGSGHKTLLVDDTYNANPDSVRAAIDELRRLPGPRWLILGDMGEVGDQGVAFHQEVGQWAKQQGVEFLWCAGDLMTHAASAFGGEVRHFPDTLALLGALKEGPSAASIWVKGSRFMKMERVVQAMQNLSASGEKNVA